MKKIFPKILIVISVVALGLIAFFSVEGAKNSSLIDVTVMSDVHFVSQKLFTADNYSAFATEDKMEHLSEAVMNSVADEIIAKKPRYLLISGDLTERGDRISHEELAKVLKRIENGGTNVYVINGNHDVPTNYYSLGNKVSASEFKEIYADFGYNEALSVFPGTLSYTADIAETHRLIAVDNIEYYVDSEGEIKKSALSAPHEEWIKEQAAKCKEEGRIPVIISHVPFKDHFPKAIASVNDKSNYIDLAEALADVGAHYAFTGHLHLEDIKTVESSEGNVFYDIASPSMIHYPCTYRSVKLFDDGIDVKTVKNDYIDEKYLSEFSPEEERREIAEGLQKYCVKHMKQEITTAVDGLDKPYGILGSVVSGGGTTAEAAKLALRTVQKTLTAPLYIKDEKSGETSLERLMADYDIALPVTEYKNVMDMSTVYASSIFTGEKPLRDPEKEMIGYIAYFLIYNINEQRGEFNAIVPEINLDIDMKKLVTEGKLECYDSGLVPLVFTVVGDNDLGSFVKGIIGESFDGLQSFKGVIDVFANGAVAGITDYFSGKEILLNSLIYDGVLARYAPELTSRELSSSELRIIFN
ncbi:MAG: metallophosphoesterase family protein [Christensenellales bacterium]